MQSRTRQFLKRNSPAWLRDFVRRGRNAIAAPPIDEVTLANYGVIPDESASPRLTLVLPLVSRGFDYGGGVTGIDLFCKTFTGLSKLIHLDFRIIITDVLAETNIDFIIESAKRAGLSISKNNIELICSQNQEILTRDNEIFFTFNWWTTLNFSRLRDVQAEIFSSRKKPIVWIMQDYEPGFMEFSSGHMLARAAYDSSSPLWGVINSSNLAKYLESSGHHIDKKFVFEPVIADQLRQYLSKKSTIRQNRILVYGRPSVERNCFRSLVRGLQRWDAEYPEFRDWELISAGEFHRDIEISPGRKLVSLGKLSIDDYAELLLSSSVGLSLMASPHPSYPPLEMSHFGLMTVTNNYNCKDLKGFHPNIISIRSIEERELSRAIAEACYRSSNGSSNYQNDIYTRNDIYPFMTDLINSLSEEL